MGTVFEPECCSCNVFSPPKTTPPALNVIQTLKYHVIPPLAVFIEHTNGRIIDPFSSKFCCTDVFYQITTYRIR